MTRTRPLHILLAEHDTAHAEAVLRAARQHHFHHTISWVTDGAAALQLLARNGYRGNARRGRRVDMLLLAVELPKLDSIEVLRRLRQRVASRRLPVIMLLDCPQQRDIVEAHELDVLDYLVRPVDAPALAASIAALGRWQCAETDLGRRRRPDEKQHQQRTKSDGYR